VQKAVHAFFELSTSILYLKKKNRQPFYNYFAQKEEITKPEVTL